VGYAPTGLFSVWNQAAKAPRSWTAPGIDVHGAVALRIDSLYQPNASDYALGALSQRHGEGYVASKGIDEWLGSRRREAKIKDNLDQFFRD